MWKSEKSNETENKLAISLENVSLDDEGLYLCKDVTRKITKQYRVIVKGENDAIFLHLDLFFDALICFSVRYDLILSIGIFDFWTRTSKAVSSKI